MKQNLAPILAASILAAAMSATSCNKDGGKSNDGLPELPSAPFTITAVEKRAGAPMDFPWTVSKAGVTDSVNEGIDDMYVTYTNELVFTVGSSSASYQGVNVVSSDESVVKAVPLDATHFALEYVADGEVTIEVSNGSGAALQKTAFKVNSLKYIKPTAVVFLYDEGTEREREIYAKEWFDNPEWFWRYYAAFIDLRKENIDDRDLKRSDFHINVPVSEAEWGYPPKVMHSLRFLRVEPENTSYRYISFVTTRYGEFVKKEFIDYLASQDLSTDWLTPYNGDFSEMERVGYLSAGGKFSTLDISLCEMSLRCLSPKGSDGLMYTAILCRTDLGYS